MDRKFPTELLNKYYASGVEKSNGAVPLVGPDFPEAEWQIKVLKEDYK